ncbi:Uncharacterised protein [Serratia proteamaculans]|nr:Uncharacterised protein [Serratia proteamaculans]CAI2000232.1 Uncharacterised protein [Serratia proteamaculans]CAI2507454.1 Uncharacterised protein [Serratia proteamaculans]
MPLISDQKDSVLRQRRVFIWLLYWNMMSLEVM